MKREMKNEVLTIRQMCDLFDVTPRALRFYEAKELLFPSRVGTRRTFAYSDQVRLKLILQGKRFGFRLEEIRVLLNLYNKEDQQQAQLSETYRLGVIHLEEMIARRDELDAAISDLQDEMQTVSTLLDQKNTTSGESVGATT